MQWYWSCFELRRLTVRNTVTGEFRNMASTQRSFLVSTLLLALCAGSLEAANPTDSEWNWPYASNSVWNMPIHRDAQYLFIGDDFYHHNKYVDDVFMARVPADAPCRSVRKNDGGPWRNKCYDSGVHPKLPSEIPFPDMTVGCGSANNTFCFAMPDGRWLMGNSMGRRDPTGPLFFRRWTEFLQMNIRGDGLDGRGHGASRLTALGGTLRRAELIGPEPIRHALKVTPWVKEYCYPSSHRWPAKSSDRYSAQYRGTRPELQVGALLALHRNADLDTLGFETEVVRKLALAAQHYGIYVVEDSSDWGKNTGAWGWVMEHGVQEETEEYYGIKLRGSGSNSPYFRDIDRLTKNLYIVNNNTADSIGGGPNSETTYPEHRLQPLLPPCGTPDRNSQRHLVQSGPQSSSAWRFGSYPDSHTNSWEAFRTGKCPSLDQAHHAAFQKMETEGCELGLVAGDMMSMDLFEDWCVSPEVRDSYDSDAEFVADAARTMYGCYLQQILRYRFKPILCLGDHEIANDNWEPGGRKAKAIPFLKKAFFDNCLHNADGKPGYTGSIGDIPQRPIGTGYAGTSYAFIHKNVMFVTVDAFQFEGADENLGRGGAATGNVTGAHLKWLDQVR